MPTATGHAPQLHVDTWQSATTRRAGTHKASQKVVCWSNYGNSLHKHMYIYIYICHLYKQYKHIHHIYIWSSYRWMETIYININNHTYTSIIYPYIPWPSKCRWSPLSTINLAPENGKALPPIFLAKSSLANMTGSREVSYKSCFKQMQLNTFKCFF